MKPTAEEIVKLNQLQDSGRFHPMTCPNRGDGNHGRWNGDLGALVATTRGWECVFCDYKQPMREDDVHLAIIKRTA